MDSTYDVIVLGGGTAGTIAAIQAGRAGAHTLLVEKNSMLGGTMTVAAINYPAHFFAWGKQIIAGIGWELVQRAYEITGQPVPTPDYTRDVPMPRHILVDRLVYATLCDEAVLGAGVDLLFHAMPATVAFEGDTWTVTVCTKTGLQETHAKVLIDATGDANAVAMAGYEVVRADVVQPASLRMQCSGYDAEALDYDALRSAACKAVAAGELVMTDLSVDDTGPELFLRAGGSIANHERVSRAETSEGKTNAELDGRRAALRMYTFLRQQPGLENFRIDSIAHEIGIRETVRIQGKSTITTLDYESGRLFEDAVCYAFYPFDEHRDDGVPTYKGPLEPNTLPTIPRGAMLPASSRCLIVAGRSISADRGAFSALRVQCPAMATGQAAGSMAALSAQTGVDPEELPLGDVHALLREHRAIIPGEVVMG
jgi:hypothetical protein